MTRLSLSLVVVVVVVVGLVVSACAAAGPTATSRGAASDSAEPSLPPLDLMPPSAEHGGRCSPASSALVAAIETRLTAEPDVGIPVPGGVSLGDAIIVKSGDGEAMYLVGARIEGQGMENVVGVWLTDHPSGSGSIFAVSTRAVQFSDWPDRADLEPNVEGYFVTEDCVYRPSSGTR